MAPLSHSRRLALEQLEERCLLSYAVTDLGTLRGGVDSYASGIDNRGQVVGYSSTSGSPVHAFFWNNREGMQDLDTLSGTSSATGLNPAGRVVGISYTLSTAQAVLWDPQTGMESLGALGGTNGSANGTNGAGQVVGFAELSDGIWHAFLWSESKGMRDLGTLGGLTSVASGINDEGQVVGSSFLPEEKYSHAFLWEGANGMRDLGALGDGFSSACGINNAGQVVGESSPAGTDRPHAFWWDAQSGMRDLGVLPDGTLSRALALNDRGQVVGLSLVPSGFHAFVYQAGKMTDLNGLIDPASGWTLASASAINEAGQIVGFGVNPKGQTHAFLLTPEFSAPQGHYPRDLLDAQRLVSPGRPVATLLEPTAHVLDRLANPEQPAEAETRVQFVADFMPPSPSPGQQTTDAVFAMLGLEQTDWLTNGKIDLLAALGEP